jgi:hypothetical protein
MKYFATIEMVTSYRESDILRTLVLFNFIFPLTVAIGHIEIGQEEVTHEKALEVCGSGKFKSSGPINNKIAQRVDEFFHKSTTFWLPNIELDNSDGKGNT